MSADLFAAFSEPGKVAVGSSTSSAAETGTPSTRTETHNHVERESWVLQPQPIPQPRGPQAEVPLWKQDDKGRDVLFDASDDEQADDDFGDFEDATLQVENQEPPVISAPVHESTDLLGMGELLSIDTSQPRDASPSFRQHKGYAVDLLGMIEDDPGDSRDQRSDQSMLKIDQNQPLAPYELSSVDPVEEVGSASGDNDWGDFEGAETESTKQAMVKPSPTALKPNTSISQTGADYEDNDDWDAFEDGPSRMTSKSPPPISQSAQTQQQSTPDLASTRQNTSSAVSTSTTPSRPTNIPPPSMLLQLLPQTYSTLSTKSRNSSLDGDISDVAHQTLRCYIVSARLIAGRSLRWKRDTLLSQSTRISQAGLKNTGMKLTSLDKSSTIKEDQDVQEAISAWQRHAAALNAVMLKAKLSKPAMSLSPNMAVRTATGPGLLTARECCAVCGLKRNERVTGIDVKVDDTFGEFWVEHWGHKDCFEFWYTYENLLSRR